MTSGLPTTSPRDPDKSCAHPGDGYSDGNEVATGYSPLVPAGLDTSGGGTYVSDSTGFYEDIIVSESIRAAGEADRENWEDTTCNPYMEDNSC